MGIKIHHGPDGTYKTSGAIKDDIIPLIKSGRTLVTNVRGFSKQNAIKVLGKKKVHKNFNVVFVDTEHQKGRDKLARFWHWAPDGAFFVIDEVQRIFKPAWREKDIQLLNVYEGSDKRKDDVPEDYHTAWDMQRHHSWDFVFTTTSITKVRSEMRDMAKVAIRHYNINIWRFYKTVEHGADSRGTSQSSQGTVKYFNWVPSKVFKLYASTKTGTFENTNPRTAFYKDPKVVGLLSLLVCIWGYVLSKPAPKAMGGSGASVLEQVDPNTQENKDSASVDNKKDSDKTASISSDDIPVKRTPKNISVSASEYPFLEHVFITGSVRSEREQLYAFQSGQYSYTTMDLQDMGFQVLFILPCKAYVKNGDFSKYVYCSMEKRESFTSEMTST